MDGEVIVTAERTHAVIDAAIQWWLARRPVGWSEAQHLERPAINTTTPREAQLASAVAEFLAELIGDGER